MTTNAVSFPCLKRNTFSTQSCRAAAGINVQIVIQEVGKDSEQNLAGCIEELIVESYTTFSGKIYHRYRDTRDMVWSGILSICSTIPQYGVQFPIRIRF